MVGQLRPASLIGIGVQSDNAALQEAVRAKSRRLAADGVLATIRKKWVADLPKLKLPASAETSCSAVVASAAPRRCIVSAAHLHMAATMGRTANPTCIVVCRSYLLRGSAIRSVWGSKGGMMRGRILVLGLVVVLALSLALVGCSGASTSGFRHGHQHDAFRAGRQDHRVRQAARRIRHGVPAVRVDERQHCRGLRRRPRGGHRQGARPRRASS